MYEVGDIVRSQAGHDRGGLFCVLDTQENYLLLADGKRRSVTSPKRKKCGHVLQLGTSGHQTIEKLRRGQLVSDRELRRALAIFRDALGRDQGGK